MRASHEWNLSLSLNQGGLSLRVNSNCIVQNVVNLTRMMRLSARNAVQILRCLQLLPQAEEWVLECLVHRHHLRSIRVQIPCLPVSTSQPLSSTRSTSSKVPPPS